MSGSVLVVDDDDHIRASLRLALEDRGFEVAEAADGEAAVDRVEQSIPDLVLVDVMLPGIDGFECCRRLRRISDVPILIVSARSDSRDVVEGLEAGADDYIRKPFDMAELTARVTALQRRVRDARPAGGALAAGGVVLNPSRGEAAVDGRPVQLTKTEFRLLYEFVSHPGQVFSREALLERVWEYGYFGDTRIVDVHMRRLRAKVEADPSAPVHLLTVRGFGYKLDG